MNNCELIEVPCAIRSDSHSSSVVGRAIEQPVVTEGVPTGLHTVLCVSPSYGAPSLSLMMARLCASMGWRSLLVDLNPMGANCANYFTVNDLLNGKKMGELEKIETRLSVVRNSSNQNHSQSVDPLREAMCFRDGMRMLSSTHDVCFIEARAVGKTRLHSLLTVADSVATVADDSEESINELQALNESIRVCATLNPRLTGVTVANISAGIDEKALLAMYSALLAEQAA